MSTLPYQIVLNHPSAAATLRRNVLFRSLLNQLRLEWLWEHIELDNTGRNNTYHNNLHLQIVALNCWQFFLAECPNHLGDEECSWEQLFVAACMHDMHHSGGELNDDENIKRATDAVEAIEGTLDKQFYDGFSRKVQGLIRVTQYPFVHIPKTRLEKILRDCDLLQSYEHDGVTSIMEGLRMELLGRLGYVPTYEQMHSMQVDFSAKAVYYTDTALDLTTAFGPRVLDAFKAYAETRNALDQGAQDEAAG